MPKLKVQMRAVHIDTGQTLLWDREGVFDPSSWGPGGMVNDAVAHALQPFNRAGNQAVNCVVIQLIVNRVEDAAPVPLPLFDAAETKGPKKRSKSNSKGVNHGG